MRVLILYEELSGYFISCVNTFAEKSNAEVHLFRKEINDVAPFDFQPSSKVHIYSRSEYDSKKLLQIVEAIKPDAVLCGGWIYKPYMYVARVCRKSIPVILAFDNKWENTLKQNILAIFGRYYLKKHFSCCWVPGKKQAKFANRIGYADKDIHLGVYSADFVMFNNYYKNAIGDKRNRFPKRFIFSGRYTSAKCIDLLWKAFSELQAENPRDWELWCLGKGDLPAFAHPLIKHFGFVQPKDMQRFITETGVFILPSQFEPWGVVVHEFAIAGFPLVCSTDVGAAELFLREGENGFIFNANNIYELKNAMNKIMSLSDKQLFEMGERSVELALQITPDSWSQTLISIINKSQVQVG